MEDAYIVNLYWARNEDAIPKTAEKYGRFCYTIAKNILTFHEEAEECVNDTYLQAWNAMPPHSPGCLRTFLGKLTRNISFNRYKHNTVPPADFRRRRLSNRRPGGAVLSGQRLHRRRIYRQWLLGAYYRKGL